jgi:hypothetical protein
MELMAWQDNPASPEGGDRFEKQASRVLSRLTNSLQVLVRSLPGLTERPADLSKTLGIHSKLAWQIHKVAHATNPLDEVANIPGNAAFGRFIDAAIRRGASEDSVNNALSAHQSFEELVRHHAGRRSAFDSMVSSLDCAGASEQIDLHYKRLALQGNSHLLGIQARTHFGALIYRRSDRDRGLLDMASISGMFDLRRFRPGASWRISRSWMTDEDGTVRPQRRLEPIDPNEHDDYNVGLLRSFCSAELPRLRVTPRQEGFIDIELEGDSIGNQSAMTCVLAHVWREATSAFRDQHNQHHINTVEARLPVEVLVHDVLFHKDVGFDHDSCDVSIYADHSSVSPFAIDRDTDKLALRESVIYLGRGAEVLATEHVPRYSELAQYVLDKLQWNDREFHVYRCLVEYPVIPSSIRVTFDMVDDDGS